MKKEVARIDVTETFMPPMKEYQGYLEKLWASGRITNQGPLLKEFESNLASYLGVRRVHFVTNGTMALQLALNALNITKGEVITTPFSYVATVSSVLWERCKPIFVDIETDHFCIDAEKIEKAITKDTKAILAVHVFGFPCDFEKIGKIAKRHGLKVIYDGAHAFGVKYNGEALLNCGGDASICSFHATKIFHTIEGGGIIMNDDDASERLELIKRFGHHADHHKYPGINGKASELQAAMGLCNLKYVEKIIEKRKRISEMYDQLLGNEFQRPKKMKGLRYNYSYYPILFETEDVLLRAVSDLNEENIYPRRYFYPSLNKLPYLEEYRSCPISEDISSRILCLPLFVGLRKDSVKKICKILKRARSRC